MIEPRLRRYSYLSSDVPTAEEIEQLQEARRRVLLAIKVRWVILGVFLLYGLYSSFFLAWRGPGGLGLQHVVVPAAALAVAALYNAWYHYSYRWFARLRHLNLVQILFDLLYVTLIVHFSGGVVSWFWAVYLVLVLEAAFLGESVRDPWAVGAAASLLYGGVLTAEFYSWIPPVPMPFENLALQHDFGYEMLKWAWVSVLCFIVAGIGAYMMGLIRRHEATLREMVIKDGLTGLYNRGYFYLRLNSEIRRADRYDRSFSLIVLDMDDFKRFNDSFGHRAGDILVSTVASVLRESIRRSESEPRYDIDLPCRVGGEEFAILLPESSPLQAAVVAEKIRERVEEAGRALTGSQRCARWEDFAPRGATVSLGLASYPDHGRDGDELFRAADDAMYRAKEMGRNRVVVADTPPREDRAAS